MVSSGRRRRPSSQLNDEQFFALLDAESNSVAVIVKHMAGNMRSRFTDFLTSDGEKPDRNRDQEFVVAADASRSEIMAAWEKYWQLVLDTVKSLGPDDLSREVSIRSEPHTVLQAINRQVAHYAVHTGQIIFLAKHLAGSAVEDAQHPARAERGGQRRLRGEISIEVGGNMVRLRSVDVLSCARIYGIIHIAIGVLIALVLVLRRTGGFCSRPGSTKVRHDCGC